MSKSTDIRTLKNLNKPTRYTIPDAKGLHLWVKADLKKYWIYRYTINSKRYDISLGSFPEITLADARTKAQNFRAMILNGINPKEEKKRQRLSVKIEKPSISFKKYALEYIDRMSPKWTNDKHTEQWVSTLTLYAFPVIGSLSLEAITTQHIQKVLDPIWSSKNETASRVRGRIERILSAAITSGLRTSSNPALWRSHLENLYPQHRKSLVHHAALSYKLLPTFLQDLIAIDGVAALALQFTILNASRTGEVLHATRSEISESVWTIPATRMKAKQEHQVPLCSQSLMLIEKAKKLDPDSPYLFSKKGKPLSGMAMLMLVRRHHPGITVHGFRSAFRDWVSEETNHSPEVAEMALAHTIGNKVEAAYRRGKLLERRRILMQDWQVYCYAGQHASPAKAPPA